MSSSATIVGAGVGEVLKRSLPSAHSEAGLAVTVIESLVVIQASHSNGVGGMQKLVVARVRCAPMTKKVDVALQLGKKLPSSGCRLHLRTILRPLQLLGRGKYVAITHGNRRELQERR